MQVQVGKRSIGIGLLVLATAAFSWAAQRPTRQKPVAAEAIEVFHSDITIASDATMTVTETIGVRSAARSIRHGIFRDFPTQYQDRLGNRYVVGFKVLGVERDGRPESYTIETIAMAFVFGSAPPTSNSLQVSIRMTSPIIRIASSDSSPITMSSTGM